MILICNAITLRCGRWFWISWDGGFIQVGEGVVVNIHPLVTWMADDAHPVHGVAIASGVDAEWEFSDIPRESPSLPCVGMISSANRD